MTGFRIVRDYPHPPIQVWRAMTDPELIPLWTATGRGGRPVGFSPVTGTRFRLVARPTPGWNGIVHGEVLEVRPPELLRHSWLGDGDTEPTTVTFRIEPHPGGARLTYEHTGFSGVGGLLMAGLLRAVRRKMLAVGLSAVLDDLDDEGRLRPGSTLRPAPLD